MSGAVAEGSREMRGGRGLEDQKCGTGTLQLLAFTLVAPLQINKSTHPEATARTDLRQFETASNATEPPSAFAKFIQEAIC